MQNRYNIEPSEDGLSYTFTTRFGIKYNLVLTTQYMGDVSTFSLSLYPEAETKHFDYWVKNTVVKIIADILIHESNVIFYICDIEDDKEDQRHNVFEYWYNKSHHEYDFIEKYNCSIRSEHGYKINSSILFNKNNYLSGYIIEQFNKEMQIR